MMEKKRVFMLCLLLVLMAGLMSSTVMADILQEESLFPYNIYINSPIGQTFTADMDYPLYTISLYFMEITPQAGVGSLTLSLYEGEGFTGSLLGSQTFSLTGGYSGYYDVSFGEYPLSVNNIYTIKIEATTERWGVGVNQTNYPGTVDYTGGHAIINGSGADYYDLRFKVTGGDTPVAPEPVSAVLFTTGGSVILASRYLRKRRPQR